MTKKNLLCLAVILFVSARGVAQTWTHYFGASEINAIEVAPNGQKWFGTSTGVWKYDGTSYAHFHSSNSDLPFDNIQSVGIAPDGTAWFGSYNLVSRFDGKTWKNYNLSSQSLPLDYVWQIEHDAAGSTWLGTPNQGLIKVTGETWTHYHAGNSGLFGNSIYSMANDSKGNMWFVAFNWKNAYAAAISRFDGEHWTTFNANTVGAASISIRNNLVVDENENVWAGIDTGVARFNGNNWTIYNAANSTLSGEVLKMAADKAGNLWCLTAEPDQSLTLHQFDGNSWTAFATSQSGLRATDLAFRGDLEADVNGNLLIGTQTQGVLLRTVANTWTTLPQAANCNLMGGAVNSVVVDSQNRKWFATKRGVSRFDGTTWTNYAGATDSAAPVFTDNTVACVDANDNIWVGGVYGISKFDGATWTKYSTASDDTTAGRIGFEAMFALFADSDKVWVGGASTVTWSGVRIAKPLLASIKNDVWTLQAMPHFSNAYISAIAKDLSGNLWVGLYDGLGNEYGVLRFDGTTWTNFSPANSTLANGMINAMTVDTQNNIWVATDEGVSRFDGENWVNYNQTNSGLLADLTHGIYADAHGNLWVNGWYHADPLQGGLSKFDGEKWTHYNIFNSGLVTNLIHDAALDAQNILWLATEQGVTAFQQQLVSTDRRPQHRLQLTLSPNPVVEQATLFMPAKTNARLLAADGRTIQVWQLAEGLNTIDCSNLQSGVYVLAFEHPALAALRFVK